MPIDEASSLFPCRETVQSFTYLDFLGDIKMKDADVEWVVFEDCTSIRTRRRSG